MEGTTINSATQGQSLRKDVVNLSQEEEGEAGRVLSVRIKTSYLGYRPNQENERETRNEAGLLPPSKPPASGRGVSIGEIRRVDLVGQAVTSSGLADVVEATMGIPTTPAAPSRHVDDTKERKDMCDPLLWSLTFRQCQLESLLPVAGLLYHLDGLIGLGVHRIDGLALAGVERVLADARCLCTLTIRHCGLARLPRLQSGSIEVLDLSNNAIESAAGLETLFRLKELNLAGNRIRTLLGLRPLVPLGTGRLQELNLESNPVQNTPRYRESVLGILPSIQLLDGIAKSQNWRMRTATKTNTVGEEGHHRRACSTSPRVRNVFEEGYFSDGATWNSRKAGLAEYSKCGSETQTSQDDLDEHHGFVRGLAGLGLIWGGAPRPRTSPSCDSSRASSSPGRVGTPRGRSASIGSSTLEGAVGEIQRSEELELKWPSGKKRCRVPSPERCRQIEGDNAR
ncbi:unnamed protein product [Ectocarpus sp. 12 AP-2014]